MKKFILTLGIILVSLSVKAQTYDVLNNFGFQYKRVAVDTQFNLPVIDTGTLAPIMMRPGAMVFRPADGNVYVWNGTQWRALEYKINARVLSVSATLDPRVSIYAFNGATATWTLPQASTNRAKIFYIKNRGTGVLTLATTAAAMELYFNHPINSLQLHPGQSCLLINDGAMWNVNPL